MIRTRQEAAYHSMLPIRVNAMLFANFCFSDGASWVLKDGSIFFKLPGQPQAPTSKHSNMLACLDIPRQRRWHILCSYRTDVGWVPTGIAPGSHIFIISLCNYAELIGGVRHLHSGTRNIKCPGPYARTCAALDVGNRST
jgi:hypothetical protein